MSIFDANSEYMKELENLKAEEKICQDDADFETLGESVLKESPHLYSVFSTEAKRAKDAERQRRYRAMKRGQQELYREENKMLPPSITRERRVVSAIGGIRTVEEPHKNNQ